LYLSFEFEFSGGFFQVDVEAGAGGMNPHAIAIVGYGNSGDIFDDDEVVIFDILEELADVDVEVALGAPLRGVNRQSPALVAPIFARPGDGGGPESGALFRGHLNELLGFIPVEAGEREPAMRLVGVGVAEEEIGDIGWLLFGFLAKAAFPRFHSFGDGYIAEAVAHVGAGEWQQEQCGAKKMAGNAH
jgi:hypothetical protein